MDHSHGAIQRRVRLIRTAFAEEDDEPASHFAERHGFGVTQWHNYERHKTQRIKIDAAIRLVELFPGLTLDFIYLDDWGSLSFPVRDKLRQAVASVREETKIRPVRSRKPSSRASRSSRA